MPVRAKRWTVVLVSIVFTACAVTYDSPVIYHKYFVPGTHDSLLFDCYYTSELDMKMTERVKPIYLYRDGSVWFGEELLYASTAEAVIKKGVSHSWGNYKVTADTIFIERFLKEDAVNNYRRVTIKGVLNSNSIHWIQREENRQNPVTTGYTTVFRAGSYKPDSTENWTRTRAQFNK